MVTIYGNLSVYWCSKKALNTLEIFKTVHLKQYRLDRHQMPGVPVVPVVPGQVPTLPDLVPALPAPRFWVPEWLITVLNML